MPVIEPPKKKPLPQVDVETQMTLLTHPEQNPTNYKAFADAATFAFEPHATTVTRVNAWWLADAAWLAYSHSNDHIKSVYQQQTGLTAELVGEGGTECTIATNGAYAIVAFRGTQPDDWQDLFSIVRWKPKQWDAGHVHGGFAEALDVAWPKVKDRLDRLPAGCRIWFAGHSLGAALAMFAALRVPGAAGICTIGSPLVGNQIFAGTFNTRFSNRSLRYVNDSDLVTRVPPEVFAFPFGRYTHVDAVRWIDPDGNIGQSAPPAFFSAAIGDPAFILHFIEHHGTLNFPSIPDSLRDHTPLHYAIHLWNDFATHFPPDVVDV